MQETQEMLGRSPGERHVNPLQYSCLENPMDRGAWWAIDHGMAKSAVAEHTCSMLELAVFYSLCDMFFPSDRIPLNTFVPQLLVRLGALCNLVLHAHEEHEAQATCFRPTAGGRGAQLPYMHGDQGTPWDSQASPGPPCFWCWCPWIETEAVIVYSTFKTTADNKS